MEKIAEYVSSFDSLYKEDENLKRVMNIIQKVLDVMTLEELVGPNNVKIFHERYLANQLERKEKGELKVISQRTYLSTIKSDLISFLLTHAKDSKQLANVEKLASQLARCFFFLTVFRSS